MDINITKFFNEVAPMDYSASKAELGETAGADTWRAACDDAPDFALLSTPEQLDTMRAFVRSSGGWDDEETAAFSDAELNALLVQWIAGDMRESNLQAGMSQADWDDYQAGCESGRYPGRIYGAEDADVFFSLSE